MVKRDKVGFCSTCGVLMVELEMYNAIRYNCPNCHRVDVVWKD
jgi:predicted RNA-binding Zn-ribbon protein involved in translation (DUF1610 family)